MNIAMISSEMAPFAKTGGLGDVVGSLSAAIACTNTPPDHVSVFMPYYGQRIDHEKHGIAPLAQGPETVDVSFGSNWHKAHILHTKAPAGVDVYFIEHPFFDRDELYQTADGDYPDNAERFALFQRAAMAAMLALDGPPDIVHAHDWQTGLIPPLVRNSKRLGGAKTIFTIHNIAYQGLFSRNMLRLTGLGWEHFTPDGVEHYGKLNFLKGGIAYADAVTTVSSGHAAEIQTDEFGFGLAGLLRHRHNVLVGIQNGIDYGEWNPAIDRYIPTRFSADDLSGKAACARSVETYFRLDRDDESLLACMVGRLTSQKGLDILFEALPVLMERGLRLAVLGTGEAKYHEQLEQAAARYPGRMGVALRFDHKLAHLLKAGSDAILMPSAYEPCGLCQMTSLKYGTIPIVRATGGLDDTIQTFDRKDTSGNGFKFSEYTAEALIKSVDAAFAVFHERPLWRRLMANAMACDFSWEQSSARKYLALYERLLHGTTLAS